MPSKKRARDSEEDWQLSEDDRKFAKAPKGDGQKAKSEAQEVIRSDGRKAIKSELSIPFEHGLPVFHTTGDNAENAQVRRQTEMTRGCSQALDWLDNLGH